MLLGLVALGAAAALPLSGCGGEAEAIGAPSPTATPAPAWLVKEATQQAAQWGDPHPTAAYWGLLRDPELGRLTSSGPDDPSHALYVIVLVGDYSKAYANAHLRRTRDQPAAADQMDPSHLHRGARRRGPLRIRHQEIRRRAVSEPSSPAPEWLRRWRRHRAAAEPHADAGPQGDGRSSSFDWALPAQVRGKLVPGGWTSTASFTLPACPATVVGILRVPGSTAPRFTARLLPVPDASSFAGYRLSSASLWRLPMIRQGEGAITGWFPFALPAGSYRLLVRETSGGGRGGSYDLNVAGVK